MRWMVAGLAVVALLAYGLYTVLVPPTGGPGWRHDPDAVWGQEARPDDLEPLAVVYASDASSLGFGITVYGSSSCPKLLRSADVQTGTLIVEFWEGLAGLGACTADAGPYHFGIVVERDRLGPPPISVIVRGGIRESDTIAFEELP